MKRTPVNSSLRKGKSRKNELIKATTYYYVPTFSVSADLLCEVLAISKATISKLSISELAFSVWESCKIVKIQYLFSICWRQFTSSVEINMSKFKRYFWSYISSYLWHVPPRQKVFVMYNVACSSNDILKKGKCFSLAHQTYFHKFSLTTISIKRTLHQVIIQMELTIVGFWLFIVPVSF